MSFLLLFKNVFLFSSFSIMSMNHLCNKLFFNTKMRLPFPHYNCF